MAREKQYFAMHICCAQLFHTGSIFCVSLTILIVKKMNQFLIIILWLYYLIVSKCTSMRIWYYAYLITLGANNHKTYEED